MINAAIAVIVAGEKERVRVVVAQRPTLVVLAGKGLGKEPLPPRLGARAVVAVMEW
jgi:hypothetical protein